MIFATRVEQQCILVYDFEGLIMTVELPGVKLSVKLR
jgi:hypothetical protein